MARLDAYTAVLFDLDNTLYEYAPCHHAGLEAGYEALNAHTPTTRKGFLETHASVRSSLAQQLQGQAASHERSLFFKRLVEECLATKPLEASAIGSRPELALLLYDAYWSAFLAAMQPAPGAHELLASLAQNHQLALISNHTNLIQLKKVVALDLQQYFQVILTSEEAGVEKPDRAIFDIALRSLGVPAPQALMVGDDLESDYQGARAAGLQAVLSIQFQPDFEAGHEIQTITHLNQLLD